MEFGLFQGGRKKGISVRHIKIGVVGCGMISSIYLKNCTQTFGILDVVAVADLLPELAQQRAEEFNIPAGLHRRGAAGRPADRDCAQPDVANRAYSAQPAGTRGWQARVYRKAVRALTRGC